MKYEAGDFISLKTSTGIFEILEVGHQRSTLLIVRYIIEPNHKYSIRSRDIQYHVSLRDLHNPKFRPSLGQKTVIQTVLKHV